MTTVVFSTALSRFTMLWNNTGGLIVLLVALGYLALCSWARWQLIALPIRAKLLADMIDIKGLIHQNPMTKTTNGHDAIGALNIICGQLSDKLEKPSITERLSWRGDTEVEAGYRLAAAQVRVPELLGSQDVEARLIVARGWLKGYEIRPECVSLGQRIDSVLPPLAPLAPAAAAGAAAPPVVSELAESQMPPAPTYDDARRRALLGQALSLTYGGPLYSDNLAWHRKTALMLFAGLIVIVVLAYLDDAAVVLLYGALGGLLQRLWQLVYERGKNRSDPLYWSTLFLAPVAGALAAVGGLHLITFLHAVMGLGPSLSSIGWQGSFDRQARTGNLGVAFLLGFSARLLGTLATRSTSATSSSVPPPAATGWRTPEG